MYKGQSTLEFLGSTLVFLIVLSAASLTLTDRISEFNQNMDESKMDMEVYTLSQDLLMHEGETDWEKSPSNANHIGLAEENMVVNESKIEALGTNGGSGLNYTQFRKLKDLNNQYRLSFKAFPVVETSRKFDKGSPPSDPPITEPNSNLYSNSENPVHYGNLTINSDNYNFLVTQHNNEYNTTRLSKNDWDFRGEDTIGENESLVMDNTNYTLKKIQNEINEPGTALILNRTIKEFGPRVIDDVGDVTKLNRYAVLNNTNSDLQPIRMEVLAW